MITLSKIPVVKLLKSPYIYIDEQNEGRLKKTNKRQAFHSPYRSSSFVVVMYISNSNVCNLQGISGYHFRGGQCCQVECAAKLSIQ